MQLGYSTNVHRGETLRQVYTFLRDYTVPVKQRLFGRSSSGLELRFGVPAAEALSDPETRQEFGAFLEANGLELFSVNAFPMQNFQARRVKEQVYAPDWRSRERARWTIAIGEILADLLPPDTHGSVSTLGGTYRPWSHGKATLERMAARYLDVLAAFDRLEDTTGKHIVLAVEPEPDTTFEVTSDLIRFVENILIPMAWRRWKKRFRSRAACEAAVRRRFTVNLDTCHFSVLFHQPARAIEDLLAAGLAIGKIHVTNALCLRNPYASPRGYDAFRGMNEPRYLHQFCGLGGEGVPVWRGRDLHELPKRLDSSTYPGLSELRTHFHVPLYLKRWKILRTTQEETMAALQVAVSRKCCQQLVLETYTWPVLTTEDRLISGITREFRWLLGALEKARQV